VRNVTPAKLSSLAKEIGRGTVFLERSIMKYRPLICPFHELMEYVPAKSNVLDIGCGSGLWLYLLSRSKIISAGTGIDTNQNKIRIANSIKSEKDDLEFIVVQPDEPFPCNKFDCVSLIDVLHHIPPNNQRAFIKKVTKLNTDLIIFKDIDPNAKIKSFMNSVHDLIVARQLPGYRNIDAVIEWLTNDGFEIIKSTRCDMLWYSHHYIIAKKKRECRNLTTDFTDYTD
jgi:SAM-dependent methyltransferase